MNNAKELEDILICPITQSNLCWLTNEQLAALNERIAKGEVIYRGGAKPSLLVAALQAQGFDLFYPVIDEIFYLLPDFALGIPNHQESDSDLLTKRQVKQFYDDEGWQSQDGVYQDAQDSEDLRAVSQTYIEQCHLRLKQFLPAHGKYLLDIASGPIQYPAYLTYSEQFQYRICADISVQALKEAKKKIGAKGIFLLCDVTQLPLKPHSMDAVISLHTLYHVPQHQQLTAFDQLYQVLKKGGKSVIVYSWGRHSLLMNLSMLPFKLYARFKRAITSQAQQQLYFYAHNYRWFCRELKEKYQTQLYCWRSVNVPFLKTFIHPCLGGKTLLKGIFWLENRCQSLMGRLGAYPVFVSEKK